MNDELSIINAQLDFFRQGKAGCVFAAFAASDPIKYGWIHKILEVDASEIDAEIEKAINSPDVTTLSLIFPNVDTLATLLQLIEIINDCKYIFIEQDLVFNEYRCLGFRVRVRQLLSWVSGFGNFDCLPKTRQMPYTEIAFRVKSRPNYTKVMKVSPPSVIHLADMDMFGIADLIFKRMWHQSLERTAQLLGSPPDLKSAAKTTFALPRNIFP